VAATDRSCAEPDVEGATVNEVPPTKLLLTLGREWVAGKVILALLLVAEVVAIAET
jgi:hypothetical protein